MRLCWTLALAALTVSPVGAVEEHSYAKPDEVRVTHLHLDLDTSFERRELAGFVDLKLDWRSPTARTLDLDTRDLSIERVNYVDAEGQWHGARYTLAPRDPAFGSRLSIPLPIQAAHVRVYYHTSPKASGLQWLTPEQTLGKQHPFLFSQSQSIHARSWVPLQDTPSVRFTFDARVTVPKGLRAVMGAQNDPTSTGEPGGFRFRMPQPIPSYLMAIAVGDLAYREIGPRSAVYAEPGRVEAAAKEFEDTEAMIKAAENLYGPYRWERYDILVLPPSFPFGGMENPRLTFATPTVIAGDKSLVALVAHELAHSWSGNLVTNASWPHFWLNEGFTTYVENRIVESLYGADEALMQERISQTEVIEEMKGIPAGDQWLVPDMKGRDPDDAYTTVPYTKGAWMLRTIERRVGRATFDPFLRGWFDDHAFQSATTEDFLAYLQKNLRATHPQAISDEELREWLYAPGIPKSAELASTDTLARIDARRQAWLEGKTSATELDGKSWGTQQWLYFLNGLPADLSAKRMSELDEVYHLTSTGNSEIAHRWFLAGIRADYAPVREPLRQYLIGIGRRKLIVPLYAELAKTPTNLAWAREIFAIAKSGYHPLTQGSVAAALKL